MFLPSFGANANTFLGDFEYLKRFYYKSHLSYKDYVLASGIGKSNLDVITILPIYDYQLSMIMYSYITRHDWVNEL